MAIRPITHRGGVWRLSRRLHITGKYNKRRRCLTMLNRWQAHKGAACGEVAPIIMCLEVAQHCSTSSTPNDSEVSAPRRLRYRSTSGYAWFAISDGTSSRRAPPTASQNGEFAKQDTMSCEACDAEPTEARHLARGERQRNPG